MGKRKATENDDDLDQNLETEKTNCTLDSPPLFSKFNDKIRPILDAIYNLRRLNVEEEEEDIPLPTIVLVGDQSSGKSSVLESLAGISLPRGEGICTRVPLIVRLQHHSDPIPEFFLEYPNKSVKILEESKIPEAIDSATVEITGTLMGVSNIPLTLLVKKDTVSDLTLIDLLGITRVPVEDQPKNIYEQISEIIMHHITPPESIILNVLSAEIDFATCESIRMSQEVDPTGQRTLAVITKSDRSPDQLLKKVTSQKIRIGLGYICVRNRINHETHEEGRIQETTLFETHPSLSMIDKSMVGIPVLAQKLLNIQTVIISKCLPNIIKKINDKLNDLVMESNNLPKKLTNIGDAMSAFTQIIVCSKRSLETLLIRGEFALDLENTHCSGRLFEMVDDFSKKLYATDKIGDDFLAEEMRVLKEARGIKLPIFLDEHVFQHLLQQRVSNISDFMITFVNKVWGYIEGICLSVLRDNCRNYPQLLSSIRKAAEDLLSKMKNKFLKRVREIIEMESVCNYTSDPQFMESSNQLKSTCHAQLKQGMANGSNRIHIHGYGYVKISHLFTISADLRDQAFDLNMKMTSYWKIVLKRVVDCMALWLRVMILKVVNTEMEKTIMDEVMYGGLEMMLEEPPSVAKNRDRLLKSIALLKESKETMKQVMDDIAHSSV